MFTSSDSEGSGSDFLLNLLMVYIPLTLIDKSLGTDSPYEIGESMCQGAYEPRSVHRKITSRIRGSWLRVVEPSRPTFSRAEDIVTDWRPVWN